MDIDQHTGNEQGDAEFQTLLTELSNIKIKYIDPTLNFYNTHGKLPMIFFGVFGVITILLSVNLPALASLKEAWGPLLVQIVAGISRRLDKFNAIFSMGEHLEGVQPIKSNSGLSAYDMGIEKYPSQA